MPAGLDHRCRLLADARRLIADANECLGGALEQHWAAGRSTYSGGTGDEIGKLFERTPDGNIFEIKREGDEFVRASKVGQRRGANQV